MGPQGSILTQLEEKNLTDSSLLVFWSKGTRVWSLKKAQFTKINKLIKRQQEYDPLSWFSTIVPQIIKKQQ